MNLIICSFRRIHAKYLLFVIIRFAKSQDWAARLPVVTLKLGKSLVDNIKLDTRILVDFVLICKNIFNITF